MVFFEKNGFGCPKLAEELCKIKEPFQIEIIGLCTDICVISNAFFNQITFTRG